MIEIRFLTLANQEVDDAVRWYEAKEQGVSRAFLDELDRVVRLIRRHPLAGMQIETEIRRFPLTRFPLLPDLWHRRKRNCCYWPSRTSIANRVTGLIEFRAGVPSPVQNAVGRRQEAGGRRD